MQQSLIQGRFVAGALCALLVSGCSGTTSDRIVSEPQRSNLTVNTGERSEPTADKPATIVHVDPKTGQIIVPPLYAPGGQTQQPQVKALTAPQSPLQETLSPVPGGGIMIHLDDRFLIPLTATIDGDGKLRIGHDLPTAESSDKK